MTKTLYIFDFDGTIFKSPEPNPSIWSSLAMGRIKSMPEEGNGFGWFQETITLDHPYVPSPLTDDSWFNKNVVQDALEAYKDTNNIVCLLTGRTELYKHLIDRICVSANLEFHHKGLKPINIPNVIRESTFEFKKRFILDLVHNQYKDQISNIIVYEDRLPHVELFNYFLGTIKSIKQFNVVHVNEEPKYLNHQDELALVDHLVTKNSNPKAELKKAVDYTGLVLDKESVDKILSLVEIPKGWFVKAHHVTLNLGSINTKLWKQPAIATSNATPAVDNNESEIIEKISNLSIETKETATETSTTTSVTVSSSCTTTTVVAEQSSQFDKYTVGSEWVAEIEAIGFSSNALAVKVKGVPTANTIPHCTVAIHPNAKASDSNQIRNWYPIDSLKPGEKITLNSLDQSELSVYKDLIEKQDLSKTDSPTKGNGGGNHGKNNNMKKGGGSASSGPIAPSVCNVLLPSNLKEDSKVLILKGTITEVGKLSFEIFKQPKKEKIIPYPIIQRVIPELSKADILKIVPKVNEWLEKSGATDIKLIEKYITTNFNDFK